MVNTAPKANKNTGGPAATDVKNIKLSNLTEKDLEQLQRISLGSKDQTPLSLNKSDIAEIANEISKNGGLNLDFTGMKDLLLEALVSNIQGKEDIVGLAKICLERGVDNDYLYTTDDIDHIRSLHTKDSNSNEDIIAELKNKKEETIYCTKPIGMAELEDLNTIAINDHYSTSEITKIISATPGSNKKIIVPINKPGHWVSVVLDFNEQGVGVTFIDTLNPSDSHKEMHENITKNNKIELINAEENPNNKLIQSFITKLVEVDKSTKNKVPGPKNNYKITGTPYENFIQQTDQVSCGPLSTDHALNMAGVTGTVKESKKTPAGIRKEQYEQLGLSIAIHQLQDKYKDANKRAEFILSNLEKEHFTKELNNLPDDLKTSLQKIAEQPRSKKWLGLSSNSLNHDLLKELSTNKLGITEIASNSALLQRIQTVGENHLKSSIANIRKKDITVKEVRSTEEDKKSQQSASKSEVKKEEAPTSKLIGKLKNNIHKNTYLPELSALDAIVMQGIIDEKNLSNINATYISQYSDIDIKKTPKNKTIQESYNKCAKLLEEELAKSTQEITPSTIYKGIGAKVERTNDGYKVTEVFAGSPAQDMGLENGYIITQAGGKLLSTLTDIEAIQLLRQGTNLVFQDNQNKTIKPTIIDPLSKATYKPIEQYKERKTTKDSIITKKETQKENSSNTYSGSGTSEKHINKTSTLEKPIAQLGTETRDKSTVHPIGYRDITYKAVMINDPENEGLSKQVLRETRNVIVAGPSETARKTEEKLEESKQIAVKTPEFRKLAKGLSGVEKAKKNDPTYNIFNALNGKGMGSTKGSHTK
jgi:hypothetical protein